jgi:hypothetical protein
LASSTCNKYTPVCGRRQHTLTKKPFNHVVGSTVAFYFSWCGACWRQWSDLSSVNFLLFFFSSPSKLHVVLFVVDISTRPILLIFNFYSWFFVKVLFVFNFVNQFQFDIYYFFSICSLFFWFFIFLFGPFVKVLLVFNFTL